MAKTPTPTPMSVIVTEPTEAQLAAQKKADAAAAAPDNAKLAEKKGGLAVAIHAIHTVDDDGFPTMVEPGTTFYPAQVDVAFLNKHEAIREPTEVERMMHERLEALQAKSADETLG